MGNGKRAKQLRNLRSQSPLREVEPEYIKDHMSYLYKGTKYNGAELLAFLKAEAVHIEPDPKILNEAE